MAEHAHTPPNPCLSIIALGMALAETEHASRRHDDRTTGRSSTGAEMDTEKRLFSRIEALRTLIATAPASSLADVAVQLGTAANNPNRSSAVGRYQFTQTTLRGMREAFGLRGDQLFDEKLQDHLFKLRMDQRGGVNQRNVALEFASVPDPDTGQSHYGQRTGSDHARGAGRFEVHAFTTGSAHASSATPRCSDDAEHRARRQ